MKDKLLALLTAKFSGVRKDVLLQMARVMALHCADETEAKGLVDKLTVEQVNEFGKDFRADVDKEVSNSTKTFEENLKKKFDFVERKVEPGDQKPDWNDPKDIAELVKAAVAEAVKPYQERLDKFSKDDTAKSRLQQIEGKLGGCKDEFFRQNTLKSYGRMSFADDNAFNEYLADLDKDIATANQNFSDTKMRGQVQPMFNHVDKDGVSSEVAEFVKEKTGENDMFSGKKL